MCDLVNSLFDMYAKKNDDWNPNPSNKYSKRSEFTDWNSINYIGKDSQEEVFMKEDRTRYKINDEFLIEFLHLNLV